MSQRVAGEGARPCDLMIIGERPGFEESRAGRPFVGPAGKELWARVWKILRLSRLDVYTTNLVKTFSTAPPTPAEIARDRHELQVELLRVKPSIILTIGYHAARALLPQFADVTGEFFHGLAFPFTYGRLTPREAIVIPSCHSSAALRQPDRYQQQLTDDLRAVQRVRDGDRTVHQVQTPIPYQVGLAGYGTRRRLVGLDTEGTVEHPEAITLCAHRNEVALVELHNGQRSPFLKASVEQGAQTLAIHHAKHDWQVLHRLGMHTLPRIDCTMLMAFHLGKAQGLKVLAFRERGYAMSSYEDLIQPIDDAQVRETLQRRLDLWDDELRGMAWRATRRATKQMAHNKDGTQKKVTKKAIAAALKAIRAKSPVPDNRVLSGLRRMLTATADVMHDDDA